MSDTTRHTVLVIAHEWDTMAAHVVEILRSNAVDVVSTTPTALCGGAVTYLSVDGTTMWASTVPQPTTGVERTISSSELGAVLNRAMHLDPTGFADEDDESYAMCERAALFTAMIESLDCPVSNRSQGTTLSGPPHLEAEWMATAVRCGLTVRSMSWTSDGIDLEPIERDLGAVTVVADRIVPSSPVGAAAGWADANPGRVFSLAGQLGCGLVRVSLGETADHRCVITQIDPRPPILEPEAVFHLARSLAPSTEPRYLASTLEYAS